MGLSSVVKGQISRLRINRQTRLTSSSSDGRTLPFLSLSENVGKTRTSPRKKVAFSSLGLEANVVGSRKLSVDMASEEKKGCEGKEARLSRFAGCLVSSRGNKSG